MNEYTANEALHAQALERARWAAVLARPAAVRPATVRRGFLARLFGR